MPSGIGRAAAVAAVERAAGWLPRFASALHRDARAPVNLTPIAGLERHLHRLQGDARLALRAVREAVLERNREGRTVAPAGQPWSLPPTGPLRRRRHRQRRGAARAAWRPAGRRDGNGLHEIVEDDFCLAVIGGPAAAGSVFSAAASSLFPGRVVEAEEASVVRALEGLDLVPRHRKLISVPVFRAARTRLPTPILRRVKRRPVLSGCEPRSGNLSRQPVAVGADGGGNDI